MERSYNQHSQDIHVIGVIKKRGGFFSYLSACGPATHNGRGVTAPAE
jgi:hypothetical protein